MRNLNWTRMIPIVLVLVVLATYSHVLTYGFTGSEIFRVITNARLETWSGLTETFSRPYMILPPARDLKLYYRPLTSLSFALDYTLWGLQPSGYHLTDLFAHLGVTLLVYAIALTLSRRDTATACFAALLYALHPLVYALVPNMVRRQDLLSAGGYLAAFYCFLRARESSRERLWTTLSILAYGLALGAKEITVILPPLIFCHAVLWETSTTPWTSRLFHGLKRTAPYLVVTVLFAGVWFSVTGGGKFTSPYHLFPKGENTVWGTVPEMIVESVDRQILSSYVQFLLYPVLGLAGTIYQQLGDPTSSPLRLLTQFVAGGLSLVCVCPLHTLWRDVKRRKIFSMARLSVGVIALLALILLVGRPVLERWGEVSVDGVGTARMVFFGALLLLVVWDLLSRYTKRSSPSLDRKLGRRLLLYGFWCLLPLLVYLVTLTRPTWRAYHGLFPLSIAAAIGLQGYFTRLHHHWNRLSARSWWSLGNAFFSMGSLSLIVGFSLVSIPATLPHVTGYDYWYQQGKVREHYLGGLRQQLADLPNGTVLIFNNFPDLQEVPEGIPHMVLRPGDMLAVMFPDRTFHVETPSTRKIKLEDMRRCCRFTFHREQVAPDQYRLTVYWSTSQSPSGDSEVISEER